MPGRAWVECIAYEVESLDAEMFGLVIVDMCLLETNNVHFLLFCNGADEVALRGRQTLDVELQDVQCWIDVLRAMVQIRRVVLVMCTRIHYHTWIWIWYGW